MNSVPERYQETDGAGKTISVFEHQREPVSGGNYMDEFEVGLFWGRAQDLLTPSTAELRLEAVMREFQDRTGASLTIVRPIEDYPLNERVRFAFEVRGLSAEGIVAVARVVDELVEGGHEVHQGSVLEGLSRLN